MEKALRKHLPNGRFVDVSPQRSKAMSAVKGKGNKTTELRLRLALVRHGCSGWKINPRGIKGKPDFFFPENKVLVFVDGCFWHGCERCGHFPRTNSSYWRAKIERNRERDVSTTQALISDRYKVLRFWEHELKDDMQKCVYLIKKACETTVR